MNYHDTEWYCSPRSLDTGNSCPRFSSRNEDPQTHELMLISKVTKYYFNYQFILYPIDQKSKNMSGPFTLYVLTMLSERIFFSKLAPRLVYQTCYSCSFRGFLSLGGSSCMVLHALLRGCFSEGAVHIKLVYFHSSPCVLYRFLNCEVF